MGYSLFPNRGHVPRPPGTWSVHACDRSPPRRAQSGWDAHAALMDALVAEGLVVLGGPVGDDGDIVLRPEPGRSEPTRLDPPRALP